MNDQRMANFEREEAERAEDARRELIDRRIRDAGFPARHLAAVGNVDKTGGFGTALRRVAECVRQPFGGLVALIGKRGPGKTQLAVIIGVHACWHQRTVRYRKAADIYDEYHCARTGCDVKSAGQVIDRYVAPKLLIIDEVQVASETKSEKIALTRIIDKRYDAGKSTILIANLEPDDLAESLGSSIVSRAQETGRVISCDWPSFRNPHAREQGAGR